MIGENGTPETPEWSPEPRPCPPLDEASRARLLAAKPQTTYHSRGCPLPDCDLCREHEATGYGVYPLPKGAVLGEN